MSTVTTPDAAPPQLARRIGIFDATMLVMGGIIGSSIFINAYVVARQVHTPFLMMAVWVAGGMIALAGAFIWAELAARRPYVGGQYAYIREAFHPAVAFVYGWGLLLVTQTGGMAAVAIAFSRYFLELTRLPVADWAVAALSLAALTVINCLGVRAGSSVQSALMVLKIVAIAALLFCGVFLAGTSPERSPLLDRPVSVDLLSALGAAMIPVLFAYGGWQTSSFCAGEMRDPQRDLPRALFIGVTGVIVLYLAANFMYARVLGPSALAATVTPASDVMRAALGDRGARIIAAGIAISTLGFLSQGMLTAPRVYFAMAQDGLFFKSVAWLHPRTRVPVLAIALQGVWAIGITLSGRYEQILNYVVSVDFMFFGLTAAALIVLRKRDVAQPFLTVDSGSSDARPAASAARPPYNVPGHPWTTLAFVITCAVVVLNTIVKYPENTLIGVGILLAGIPAYLFWKRHGQQHA